MSRSAQIAMIACALLCAALNLRAQPCVPSWSNEFVSGMVDNAVYASVQYDFDGPGPGGASTVIAGNFLVASGVAVPRIARWTVDGWRAVGPASQQPSSRVTALAVYDDGTGPALFAAGGFTAVGSTQALCIMRWNGSSWSPVAGGLGPQGSSNVNALCVFDDDGPGPRPPGLYAAGQFGTAGSQNARNIARWDGASWSNLGLGLGNSSSRVAALTVADLDGPGPLPEQLIAGGLFESAGGAPISWLAAWNGSAWTDPSPLPSVDVSALAVFDEDGAGPATPKLFAAAKPFTGEKTLHRLDGTTWTPVSPQGGGTINALWVGQEGPYAGKLYAMGQFGSIGGVSATAVASWDGSQWQATGSGLSSPGIARTAIELELQPGSPATRRLLVGGEFLNAGPVVTGNVATWDGGQWWALGNSVNGPVNALAVFDADGTGPGLSRVVIGGSFTSAGPVVASGIVAWNGTSFESIGAGIAGLQKQVLCFTEFDFDGPGPLPPALVAGGSFTSMAGVPANCIARWNGSSWSALGSGFDAAVRAVAVYDSGDGPMLYAGGAFQNSGIAATRYIATWNGSTWVQVSSSFNNRINALAVFDEDGPGPGAASLFVGHDSPNSPGYLGRWNGTAWSSVGAGVSSSVTSLAALDIDGPGPLPRRLYVGGSFLTAGGLSAPRLASWDGTAWQTVGVGIQNGVDSEPYSMLALDDDGAGPRPQALYVAGRMLAAGPLTVNRLARFDGADWYRLRQGVSASSSPVVNALATWDRDGKGPDPESLYVGGDFLVAGTASSSYFARWGCSTQLCYANCDASTGSPVLTSNDFACFLDRFASGDAYANCDGSTGTPTLTSNDFACFLNRFAAGCP